MEMKFTRKHPNDSLQITFINELLLWFTLISTNKSKVKNTKVLWANGKLIFHLQDKEAFQSTRRQARRRYS